eukprot:14886978-Alexandrium_andersonii.AAC.1
MTHSENCGNFANLTRQPGATVCYCGCAAAALGTRGFGAHRMRHENERLPLRAQANMPDKRLKRRVAVQRSGLRWPSGEPQDPSSGRAKRHQ